MESYHPIPTFEVKEYKGDVQQELEAKGTANIIQKPLVAALKSGIQFSEDIKPVDNPWNGVYQESMESTKNELNVENRETSLKEEVLALKQFADEKSSTVAVKSEPLSPTSQSEYLESIIQLESLTTAVMTDDNFQTKTYISKDLPESETEKPDEYSVKVKSEPQSDNEDNVTDNCDQTLNNSYTLTGLQLGPQTVNNVNSSYYHVAKSTELVGVNDPTRPCRCDECGKYFKHKNSLKAHKKTHSGERPVSCKLCNKSFTKNSDLNRHMRIHTGYRPHKCEICGKTFTQRSNLTTHERTHTGDKPFSCQDCGKCFSQKAMLMEHVFVHTHGGEKPHKCDKCDRSYFKKSDLVRHMLVHTGERPFKCHICDKAFFKNSDLKLHLRMHAGDKPFKCEFCGKGFLQKSNMMSHFRKHPGSDLFQFNVLKDISSAAAEMEVENSYVENFLHGQDRQVGDVETATADGAEVKTVSYHEKNSTTVSETVTTNDMNFQNTFDSDNSKVLNYSHKEEISASSVTGHCQNTAEFSEQKPQENSPELNQTEVNVPTPLNAKLEPVKSQVVPELKDVKNQPELIVNTTKANVLSTPLPTTAVNKLPVFSVNNIYDKDTPIPLPTTAVNKLPVFSVNNIYDKDPPIPLPTTAVNKQTESSESTTNDKNSPAINKPTSQGNTNDLLKGTVFFEIDEIIRQARVPKRVGRPSNNPGKVTPYKCEECNKYFTQRSNLLTHLKIHTGDRPYECPICHKKFIQKNNLAIHSVVHTGIKPVSCDECGKSFSQKSSLTAHKKIHLGLKPVKCMVCNKGFTKNSDLTRHMRTHTGAKPFKCLECDKQFAQRSNMLIHLNTHFTNKAFQCEKCDKSFAQKMSLNAHILKMHPDKPYKCEVCDTCFAEAEELTVHMKDHLNQFNLNVNLE